jgi:penicillin-binding protein 1A
MDFEPLPDPGDPTTPRSANPEPPRVLRRVVPPRRAGSPPPKTPPARGSVRRHIWRWLWLYAVGLGGFSGLLFAAMIHMPEVDKLDDFTPGLVTELYDREGKRYATYALENRVMLRQGEVPQLLEDAIIAVEDERFEDHGGVDLSGVLRAVVENVRAGRITQGASTLTMQVAENLFHTRGRDWRRKVAEALLAVEIEKRYSKEHILTLYCNLVYMGEGQYGMEAAAQHFFNKPVGRLSLVEAATLAGIPQRPNRFNPRRNPAEVTVRRNHVLLRMRDSNKIDDVAYRAAIAEPLLVAQGPVGGSEENGFFPEEVRRHLEQRYGSQRLYGAGLRVRTTIDPAMQAAAEQALRRHLVTLDRRRGWRGPTAQLDREDLEAQTLPSWPEGELAAGEWYEGIVLSADGDAAQVAIAGERFTLDREGMKWTRKERVDAAVKRGDVAWFRLEAPEGGGPLKLMLEQEPKIEGVAVILESATGAVRAMVGGWSFERSKFNRVTQAQRQVGSAFKPFVYGAAIEQGFTAADTLFDAPTGFTGADAKISYFPQNYYKSYTGIVTMRRALELSVNVPAVKMLDLVGVQRVVEFARRCGIRSDLPPYPSLALGSADLVPLELAAAYSAIANHGILMSPYFIEQVSTAQGEVLEQHTLQAQKAMDASTAYVLTHMMEGVVDRGTAASMASLDVDLAGKTGTTDDYSDAWYVGYTPRLTILTWTGHDVKKTLGGGMSGAVAGLPPWKEIAERGLAEGWIPKGERFVVPPGVTMAPVEYYTGLRAPAGSASYLRVIEEAFVSGTEPTREWEPLWSQVRALPWHQQRAFYIPKEGERMP